MSADQVQLLSRVDTPQEQMQDSSMDNYSCVTRSQDATDGWQSLQSGQPRQRAGPDNSFVPAGLDHHVTTAHGPHQVHNWGAWSDMPDDQSQVTTGDQSSTNVSHGGVQQWQYQNQPQAGYPRICKRTLIISDLPDGTCYADLTGAIRGGKLLNIFLKTDSEWAFVSFLREEDATRFYNHAINHGVFVKTTRVSLASSCSKLRTLLTRSASMVGGR
jgi:hypothetical protein